jgi:hypothetical protein
MEVSMQRPLLVCLFLGLLAANAAEAGGKRLEVTITNLTRGQRFTPILVASHRAGVRLFDAGSPASAELALVAEEGNTGPLATALMSMPDVKDVQSSGALLNPGASVTVTVSAPEQFRRVSVVAMLIPTNDAFFSVTDVAGPHGTRVTTVYSPAYDSGTEVNDELCRSIPGPFFDECGGPGGGEAVSGGEEGYVHVHGGMHGIGDMDPARRDWRNPVARIVIRRVD